MTKYKLTIITLSVALLITLGLYSFSLFNDWRYGDVSIRERMISSTIWELSEKGYVEQDILSIKSFYNPWKGVYPFNHEVEVVFRDEPNAGYLYFWDREEMRSVDQGGNWGKGQKHFDR